MEDISKFEIPDFSPKQRGRKKQGPKKIEKEVLPRTNRWTKCAFCQLDRVHNPDQYQKRFDYFGSEEGILRNWKCQDCETEEKTNPFKFWFKHSDVINDLANEMKKIFESFLSDRDALKFQNTIIPLFDKNGIKEPNFKLITNDGSPEGLHINFPFVGNVLIKPLEYRLVDKIQISN
jgi:hypothetical protein